MGEIDFRFDWVDPEGVQGPELHATWAELTLRIGGSPVTTVLDEKSKTARDHVYVPLYPLAEWLATHWWILFHEVEVPRKSWERPFLMRHSLRDARDGYALPALSIHPQGETVRLVWEQENLPHHRVNFLTSGQEVVQSSSLRTALSDFIGTVVRRLQELGIEKTVLEEEWTAISSADPEEQNFCAAAAALGLDPYAIDDTERQEIAAIGETIPRSLRAEFFSVAAVDKLSAGSKELLDALEVGRANRADLHRMKDLRSKLLVSASSQIPSPPWRAGYAAAKRVRELLNLDSQPLPTLEAISNALGTTPSELNEAVRPASISSPLFDAVVEVNEKGSPGFVLSSRREEAQRFHLCRGFFEFLTSSAPEPAMLTKANSDKQAKNRAFAAEFLAPAAGLRNRVSGKTVASEEVDELAAEFGVPPLVISHQLENHSIAFTPAV